MHGLIFETSVCYWQNQPGYLSRDIDTTSASQIVPSRQSLGKDRSGSYFENESRLDNPISRALHAMDKPKQCIALFCLV